MIKTICDVCGKTIDSEPIFEMQIPRVVTYYAMSHGVKIMAFDKIETCQTHMCNDCGCKLARTLPTID